MARFTSHYYLFAHNPRLPDIRPRRLAEGYPEEGDGVQYTHQNRPAITTVANTVHQLGIHALFPVLPELLTPDNDGLYHNTLMDIVPDLRALFIWDTLDIGTRLVHHNARHVVHIHICSEAPYNAGQLALALLRLLHNANPHRLSDLPGGVPKLKDLLYAITPSAVYASAYFTGFERAYSEAAAETADDRSFLFTTPGNCILPVTTWPQRRTVLAAPEVVADCYSTVQSLNRI